MPLADLIGARQKAQLVAEMSRCEIAILEGAASHGEHPEWVAMLRRVADLLESYHKATR